MKNKNQNTFNKLKGFTLVELLITILLLGILGVTALPKFIGMGSDATAKTLQHLAGAMKSTANIRHSVAALNAANGGLDNGFINDGVLFDQGYPVALDFDVPFGSFNNGDGTPEILEAMDINLDEWTFNTIIEGTEDGQRTRELYITSREVAPSGTSALDIIATQCYASYDSFLLVPRAPVVKYVTSGC